MTAAACETTLLGGWWPQTGRSLQTLAPRAAPLAPELAEAAGGGGRVRLRAALVPGRHMGARRVPAGAHRRRNLRDRQRPRLPGRPAHAADVRGRRAGLRRPAAAGVRGRADTGHDAGSVVARRTAALADRFGRRPADPELPRWAIDYSPGNYFVAREADVAELEPAYRAYLDLWVELLAGAAAATAAPGGVGLSAFKQGHLAHWPGAEYLAKCWSAPISS